MELPMQQIEQLTEQEQQAWHKLAQELIFIKDPDIDLNPNSVDEISEAIQREMLELPVTQIGKDKYLTKAMNRAFEKIGLGSVDVNMEPITPKSLGDINELATINSTLDAYQSWGFTPRLAQTEDGDTSLNCLGKAIALGTELKQSGLLVKIAISPDHPYVIVKYDNKDYLLGYKEGPIDIEKWLTQKDSFGIVNIPDNTDNDGKPRMLLVTNFNHGVLHEVLENFAVLQQMGKQGDTYLLPGTAEKGKKILGEHNEIIDSANWKSLQCKVLPHMQQMFESEEWQNEVKRMQEVRDEQYRAQFLDNAFEHVHHLHNEPITQADQDLMQKHGLEIYGYIAGTQTEMPSISPKIDTITTYLKEKMKGEPQTMQTQLKASLRRNLNLG